MGRPDIAAGLPEHEAGPRGGGGRCVFGSPARGDVRPDRDAHVMVEFDPIARVSRYDHVSLTSHLVNCLTAVLTW
jgi:hypothetical protein